MAAPILWGPAGSYTTSRDTIHQKRNRTADTGFIHRVAGPAGGEGTHRFLQHGRKTLRDPGVEARQGDTPLIFGVPGQNDLKIRVEHVEGPAGLLRGGAGRDFAGLRRGPRRRLQAKRGEALRGSVETKGQHPAG